MERNPVATELELAKRALGMRHNPTEPEKRLWRSISNSQLGGYKFRRQHIISGVIVDFFCPAIGLIVEIDGDTHNAEEDSRRDRRMTALGFTTIRVTNPDVMRNVEGVLLAILEKARSLPQRWPGRPTPPPQPLP